MTKPTDIAVRDVEFWTDRLPFRAPLKFGGRVMAETELVNVRVRARTASGTEGVGLGSMPLGNVWAWPSPHVDATASANAIRQLAEMIADAARGLTEFAHPIDHVIGLCANFRSLAERVARDLATAEPIPKLAILVAASSTDAALHDAFGKANQINSFDGLGETFMAHDLSRHLGPEFQGEYLDRYTSRAPKPRMPLYHLVGALDPLTGEDVANPIGDGLPETLGEWIARDGLTHLKIKLAGDDLDWDVERVVAVERVAAETQKSRGCERWVYSLDFNERCENVEYVLDFLGRVEERVPVALDRVEYIEQPTHRDLNRHPQPMHRAAARKPVVIDESLVDYESLVLAREQGYSGVALKACKGHTEALLMGAAAQKFGMFLCVQDLTCVGASFLHSAEIAARIPTARAIEGNGRQYCPAGNAGWNELFPGMFNITDGTLDTSLLTNTGLGHHP